MNINQLSSNKKIVAISTLFIILILISSSIIMASNDTTCVTPESNQYFELRATEVKSVDGQNQQVVMELWGNNIEFKRI